MPLTEREKNLIAEVRQYERSLTYDWTPQEAVVRGIIEDEFGFTFEDVAQTAAIEGGCLSDVLESWVIQDYEARR